MSEIKLTQGEADTINDFATRQDFPGGYAYISDIIKKHPEFDQTTAFWFEKARLINMNVRSDPADVYIRSVTACGLRWDGRLGSNAVKNARMLQNTSNDIAKTVLTSIVTLKAITNVNTFLNSDIVGALAAGQTIAGWGGAFYYWGAPFVPPGGGAVTSVGSYILSHPDEREKFVACNAAASLDAVLMTDINSGQTPSPDYGAELITRRLDLLFQGLQVSRDAQAPAFIKDEIRKRATAIALGGRTAGDPNQIGDYTYNGYAWVEPRMYVQDSVIIPGMRNPVSDPNVVSQLNARRTVRSAHKHFNAPGPF